MSATTEEAPHVRLPVEIQNLVAQGKISLHAGWLYGLLLAHINYERGDTYVWPSRSNLATRLGLRKTQSVDRYLKELADAGLIEKETRKSDKRGNESNRYTLMLVSWPKRIADPRPLHGTSPSPLARSPLDPWKGHELDEPQLDQGELDPRTDQSGSPSGRFAPFGAGDDEHELADPWNTPARRQPSTAEKLTRKRADDRELFLSLVDADMLRSDGSTFGEGVWTVEAFYDAFRTMKSKKPVGFPGAYVMPMYEANEDQGVRDWLLTLGLRPVEAQSRRAA